MAIRIRATFVIEYDADPGDYGTDVPADMASVDEENYTSGSVSLDELAYGGDDVTIAATFEGLVVND